MFKKEFLSLVDRYPGFDYFYESALRVSNSIPSEYPFLEIGTRKGGSALFLMQAIIDSNNPNRPLITVDPFGSKPYNWDDKKEDGNPYDDKMYKETMFRLSKFAFENNVLHIHYKMTSSNFIKIFPQIEIWSSYKFNQNMFAFVYLDGDHSTGTVEMEIGWFMNKIVSGGILLLDDFEFHLGTTNPIIKDFLYTGKGAHDYSGRFYYFK